MNSIRVRKGDHCGINSLSAVASLTLPIAFAMGPFPLPLAGEGIIARLNPLALLQRLKP